MATSVGRGTGPQARKLRLDATGLVARAAVCGQHPKARAETSGTPWPASGASSSRQAGRPRPLSAVSPSAAPRVAGHWRGRSSPPSASSTDGRHGSLLLPGQRASVDPLLELPAHRGRRIGSCPVASALPPMTSIRSTGGGDRQTCAFLGSFEAVGQGQFPSAPPIPRTSRNGTIARPVFLFRRRRKSDRTGRAYPDPSPARCSASRSMSSPGTIVPITSSILGDVFHRQ